jgi:3-methyladenine DNA glycosylase AlkD
MTVTIALDALKEYADPSHLQNYERFCIEARNALGVRVPNIRKIAKDIGRNHELSLELMQNETHEAKLLAPLLGERNKISTEDMDRWVRGFYSWDLVDNACRFLVSTPYGLEKAAEYRRSDEEFVRRTGLVMLVAYAIHHKEATEEHLNTLLVAAMKCSSDDRVYVKKAVSWLIRTIGKKSIFLHQQALKTAEQLEFLPVRSAQWIARDVQHELTSGKVLGRIQQKKPA